MKKTTEKIIIYGCGERGKALYDFLCKKGIGNLVDCFVDSKADNIKEYNGIKVFLYGNVSDDDKVYLISPLVNHGGEEIKNRLAKDQKRYYTDLSGVSLIIGEDHSSLERDWIAYSHINGFNTYFENAENALKVFWDENTEFKRLFDRLDKEKIIEFACGKGRHVDNYIQQTEQILLVDVLKENIDYCKDRFRGNEKISYLVNNGKDLEAVSDESYTSLFSYDAMVHFEMINIWEYLGEFNRVLAPGGLALIHHSNNHSDYKTTFTNGEYGRNYMSKDLFAYMAYRNGFEIVEQSLIDWGGRDIDCLSLIRKRKAN